MTKKTSTYKGKTLEEIVEMSITEHGYELFTDGESVCDMQDAIAKMPQKDYEAYVSKCLHNDEYHQKVIMCIIANAHSALDAAKMYSRIANHDFQEERDELEKENKDLSQQLEITLTNAKTLNSLLFKEKHRAEDLENQIASKDQEIMRLKAKLYDMMENK